MDIKCRKTSCSHNKGYTCVAHNVLIGEHAECNSFDCDITKLGQDYSKNMFEADTEHYNNSRHMKNVALSCERESCLFNKDNRCVANGITVLDEKDTPQCGTFIQDK